ncbi:hypothetical protein CRG98_012081 [Punica granatum]|uniref:Retrotransposon gag domain-containing protein n=1 Tax=Punica granatum TaxID=22663 RepID=A0A2I0KG74_PUNGR|nr:hypothetical protein CRG98_012081 [Punica granatum]
MAHEDQTGILEEINPPAPVHPQSPTAQATLPPNSARTPPAYLGAPAMYFSAPTATGASLPRLGFPPPPLGTMNLMATNMAEMMTLLRDPNRASSNSTPPLARGPTVDPASWAPPTLAPEGDAAVAALTTLVHQPAHVSTVHPAVFFQPQPTVLAIAPLPPMMIHAPGPTVFASPPLSIPISATVYIVPPPTVFLTSNASAPAPAQRTSIHAAPVAPPTNFLLEAETEQERRMRGMEETIRALQASEARLDINYGDCSLFPGMRLPPKVKVSEFKNYEGTTDPRHHLRHYRGKMLQYWNYEDLRGVYYSHLLAHTSSFSDHIEAEKKLDLGIKLGRMEGPAGKGEKSSKKASTAPTSSSGRRGKEGQQGSAAQPRPRRQYPSLPVPLSHIYRQLRASDKIETIAPGPNFDPTTQDQSKHCEYHRGALGHTLDNCWRLREKIQEMIYSKELSFNADDPSPFVIEYIPTEATVGFMKLDTSPTPFLIDVPDRESYLDNKVPWTYEGDVWSLEHSFSVMGVTQSGPVYENPRVVSKGKAPAATIGAMLEVALIPPKEALNVCPVTTLKQMNVDLNRIRPSKTSVRGFDGSWKEVNGEIDLLIDVGPCSFSVTF